MTENIDTLYDIVTSFEELFTEAKITFKATKYKSSIDLYFHHKISGHITISLIFDNINLNILPKERKIGDLHLAKLINNNYKTLHTDNFIDVLTYASKIIPKMTNYCVGCGTILDIESKLYINCGKDACVYECEELPIGDFVCNFAKSKPSVAECLLMTGMDAARSQRRETIFEPFPHYFMRTTEHLKRGELTALKETDPKRVNDMKDFAGLDKTLSKLPFTKSPASIIAKLKAYDTDIILEEEIGTDAYNLLRFFLMSAEFDINEVELFKEEEYKSVTLTSLPKRRTKRSTGAPISVSAKQLKASAMQELRQYEILHPPKTEAVFKGQKADPETCYLFHGSGRENWFSIMRNGLKVASHTKIMTAGAAYGTGIYTSNHFETSMAYTRVYGAQTCVMGVFEAASPTPDRWKKGHSVYVIPDAKDLILRYLLVVPPGLHAQVGSLLNTKFGKTLKQEKKVAKVSSAKRSNKRIMAELRQISKPQVREGGLSVEPEEDNMMIWNAYMHTDGFDKTETLTKNLIANGISHIHLELRFPDRYPYEPPFVRVVSPRFKFRTGHITVNGAICHELLSHQSWLATCKVENLLVDIRCNILEGEAELDTDRYSETYSFEGAKVDYDRVMRSHGWLRS